MAYYSVGSWIILRKQASQKNMPSKQYDLAVAYRIYPGVSKAPVVHGDNKYNLAEVCLRSFRASLGTLKARIWVLLDNCPVEYEQLFKQYFDPEDLELISLKKAGNAETFRRQVDILLRQSASENIYFAEDDYYYLPNQFESMISFLNANTDAHFVTPYDHLDYYTLDLHKQQTLIRVSENRHWRTANSTCLTFLTTKSTLEKTQQVFMTYTRNNFDSSLWLCLTKQRLFNVGLAIGYLLGDQRLFRMILAKAWLFGWRQILFGRKWRLWVPIPSIATTLEKTCLAPTYDWQNMIMNDLNNSNS